MKWSEHTWQAGEEIYHSILKMPFIEELANGSLTKEKFQFYIAQDSIYLEHFGRTLALIGAKLHDVQDALTYIRFAENAVVVENALHESYFKDFEVSDKGLAEPACHHYIHFLRSTAAFEPVEVALAATLPCFWIYQKVGDYIYNNQQSHNNPYQKWINTYAGDEFAIAVQKAIDICDNAAKNATPEIRARMTAAFFTASRMEHHFWESAYDLKIWK
ncbi:thiaminase/transcriptional activator TenA [Pedobacter sp. UYP24]